MFCFIFYLNEVSCQIIKLPIHLVVMNIYDMSIIKMCKHQKGRCHFCRLLIYPISQTMNNEIERNVCFHDIIISLILLETFITLALTLIDSHNQLFPAN